MHYVPFGSLVPSEADNIVAAGRCVDGDNAALSSVRVGPCIAMGAAPLAGLAQDEEPRVRGGASGGGRGLGTVTVLTSLRN